MSDCNHEYERPCEWDDVCTCSRMRQQSDRFGIQSNELNRKRTPNYRLKLSALEGAAHNLLAGAGQHTHPRWNRNGLSRAEGISTTSQH